MTLSVGIYFVTALFSRRDPKSYIVKKYVESGEVKLDPKNLFHIFVLYEAKTLMPIDLEKEKDFFEVEARLIYPNETEVIKYRYDKCNKYDFEPISNLYSEVYLNFYCIRKMLDLRHNSKIKEEDNYVYNLNNYENLIDEISYHNTLINTEQISFNNKFIFPWLSIQKSEEADKILFYEINISKCFNTTDKHYKCKSEEEIANRINSVFFLIKFVDNIFDVGNYVDPIDKYMNIKSTAIKPNMLTTLFMNFYSVNILTRDGLIFDSRSELKSYAFDFYSETYTETHKNLIHKTQFWILNNAQIYDRSIRDFKMLLLT